MKKDFKKELDKELKKELEKEIEIINPSVKEEKKEEKKVETLEELVSDENLVDENLVDENLVDENLVDENLVDENLVDENLVDENLVDENLVDENLVDENLVDENLVDENLVDDDLEGTEVLEEMISNVYSLLIDTALKSGTSLAGYQSIELSVREKTALRKLCKDYLKTQRDNELPLNPHVAFLAGSIMVAGGAIATNGLKKKVEKEVVKKKRTYTKRKK